MALSNTISSLQESINSQMVQFERFVATSGTSSIGSAASDYRETIKKLRLQLNEMTALASAATQQSALLLSGGGSVAPVGETPFGATLTVRQNMVPSSR